MHTTGKWPRWAIEAPGCHAQSWAPCAAGDNADHSHTSTSQAPLDKLSGYIEDPVLPRGHHSLIEGTVGALTTNLVAKDGIR